METNEMQYLDLEELERDYKQSFQCRLKDLREELGFTRRELGSKIGKSEKYVALYELGLSKPNAAIIFKICMALGCSADYLIGLRDDDVVR